MQTERKIAPIVSTDWLKDNSGLKNLVILDIRSAADYVAGHIDHSVNIPFEQNSGWAVTRDNLTLEVPDKADLFGIIGSCGITTDSLVVVVSAMPGAGDPPYPLADATRVADMFIYAGVENVALLDGGYPKWLAESKPVTKENPQVKKTIFQGSINDKIFVTREYVEKHIGKITIIDARDADVFFGVTTEPFDPKAGHIPSAKSLPSPWIWNKDGTYKSVDILEAMALGVVGQEKKQEIIVYCSLGGYASAWWYVLTQVLRYENIKYYDGSAEDWVRSNSMILYSWN